MTAYPHSLVVIVADADVDAAKEMARALGYEAGFSVPLSPDGSEPATHWGLCAWARADFVAVMTGVVTPAIENYTEAEIVALLAKLTVSVDADGLSGKAHFEAVAAAEGLIRAEPVPP